MSRASLQADELRLIALINECDGEPSFAEWKGMREIAARLHTELLLSDDPRVADIPGETLEVTDTLSDAAFLDECAMRAMQAVITNGKQAALWIDEEIAGKRRTERTASVEADAAQWSYGYADAMLAERKRRRE